MSRAITQSGPSHLGATNGTATLVWLGSAPPTRSIRWIDGLLAAAAKFEDPIALAAGDAAWLDLAADRAGRAGIASAGVPTDLSLDYVGWAQVVAAVARQVRARTILADEVSRLGRDIEVGAIAELVEAPQLTRVVALAADGDVIHATRANGRELQTLRVRAPAVIGTRIAGKSLDDYPPPMPSGSMQRLDLVAIGLDPIVLAHRALPPRTSAPPRKTAERVAELIASFTPPRGT